MLITWLSFICLLVVNTRCNNKIKTAVKNLYLKKDFNMKLLKLVLLLLLTQSLSAQKLLVSDLSCEHKINPMGIDLAQPRLSWKINGTGRNIMQTSYSIRVATNKNFAAKTIVWQSEKINSAESVLQSYAGKALQSGQRYYWQVKVWDANKNESVWSTAAFWDMGLLQPNNWKANWIQPVQDTTRHIPGLLVRKDFVVKKKIATAKVYVTSHGFYELYFNGKKAGDEVLTDRKSVV